MQHFKSSWQIQKTLYLYITYSAYFSLMRLKIGWISLETHPGLNLQSQGGEPQEILQKKKKKKE